MFARQTRITGDPARIETAIEAVRSTVLPALQGADGFKGFTLLVDRESGDCVGTSYFESREALEASEAAVREARDRTAAAAGAEAPDVRFFEVAVDTQA